MMQLVSSRPIVIDALEEAMTTRLFITLLSSALIFQTQANIATALAKGFVDGVNGINILWRLGIPIGESTSAKRLVEAVERLPVADYDADRKYGVLEFLKKDRHRVSLREWNDGISDLVRLLHPYTDSDGILFPFARTAPWGQGEFRFDGSVELRVVWDFEIDGSVELRVVWDSEIANIAKRLVPWHERNALITILERELPDLGFLRPSPQEFGYMSTERLALVVLMVRMRQFGDPIIRHLTGNIFAKMRHEHSDNFFDPSSASIKESFADEVIFATIEESPYGEYRVARRLHGGEVSTTGKEVLLSNMERDVRSRRLPQDNETFNALVMSNTLIGRQGTYSISYKGADGQSLFADEFFDGDDERAYRWAAEVLDERTFMDLEWPRPSSSVHMGESTGASL